MIKNGDLKKPAAICDYCSEKAVIISDDVALCQDHSEDKTASEREPMLKNAALRLVGRHREKQNEKGF